MTQQSPVYGSLSAARCAYCGALALSDLCRKCTGYMQYVAAVWRGTISWYRLSTTYRWPSPADDYALAERAAPLFLQQRRALLRQAMAEGVGRW